MRGFPAGTDALLRRLPQAVRSLRHLPTFVLVALLIHASPSRPHVRGMLGTSVLTLFAGGRRYMPANALSYDGLEPVPTGQDTSVPR